MNRRKINIVPYVILFILILFVNGKMRAQEIIHLFPDRSFAVSGDTVWFSIFIYSDDSNETSEVVHVQLDDLANNHVSKVSILCSGKTGEGYIHIPDSLSTGIYVLKPFSLVQKISGKGVINQKLITVYNRFDNETGVIEEPDGIKLKRYDINKEVVITTGKEQYEKGENVNVEIRIPGTGIDQYKKVFAFAGLADPFSQRFLSGWIPSSTIAKTENPVMLTEKNGILISGKVVSNETDVPVANAIVLLSIPDTIPFFDYCISDSAGEFYFYLRNATGVANLVIQALSQNEEKCKIKLSYSFIEVGSIPATQKILTLEETTFIGNIIKASYYSKLFKGYKIGTPDNFMLPMQFKYPFYGPPTKTYYPDLFVDLPDFREISREILHGVQYRERKGGTTIRLQNQSISALFSQEPLRLLDGIPVFDNKIFAPMGTNDIKKVDVVFYKRFYGDLTFNGVLSVYTKNKSLDWVDLKPGIGHFEYSCLQLAKRFEFMNGRVPDTHVPNLNKVLFRTTVKEIKSQIDFNFFTSDIKGDVEINVILIDKNNHISYAHKFIDVK